MDFEFIPGRIKSLAKDAFHAQWGVAILVSLFTGFFAYISEVRSVLIQIEAKPETYVSMFGVEVVNKIIDFYKGNYMVILIVTIAVNLFLAILQYGECKVFIDVVEGRDASFSTVFDGLLYVVKAVAAHIYVIVLTFLWTLLFIIPGFVAVVKYSMTY